MLSRLSSMATGSGRQVALRFFSSQPNMQQQFHQKTFEHYCSKLPPFSTILPHLQSKGQFLTKTAASYSMNEYLTVELKKNNFISQSSSRLLVEKLPIQKLSPDKPLELTSFQQEWKQKIPAEYKKLENKLGFYLSLLIDVFDNKFSERKTDASGNEALSERLHSLQAAKLTTLFGFSSEVILAMLFHGIGRLTQESDHAQSYLEGESILAPLALSLPYAGQQVYAQYLLSEFCPPYQDSLSPLTKVSLSKPMKVFEPQIQGLNALESMELAKRLYQLMFLRLVDDCSKVSEQGLKQKVEYLHNGLIQKMLMEQMTERLKTLLVASKNPAAAILSMENQLDTAMELLLRAQEQSNNPELYKAYFYLLEPKPGWRW